MSNIVTWALCCQSYAEQLEENERRLAELMRIERLLRYGHTDTVAHDPQGQVVVV